MARSTVESCCRIPLFEGAMMNASSLAVKIQ
ncbi:Uncharacterised protein [Bordetella pertussis]|nr:Uncharacterised protein [Bordetella pertussis]